MNIKEFAKKLGFSSTKIFTAEERLINCSEAIVKTEDFTWYVTYLPSKDRYSVWDDSELSLDRVVYFDTREEAINYIFEKFSNTKLPWDCFNPWDYLKMIDIIVECRDCGGVSESMLTTSTIEIGEKSPFHCGGGGCGDEEKYVFDYYIDNIEKREEYDGYHSLPRWAQFVESSEVIIGRGKNPLKDKVEAGKFDSMAIELGFQSAEDLSKDSELVVNEEGFYWLITQLSDGRWVAWDEHDFDPPKYFSSREEALEYFRKKFEEEELPETDWLLYEKRPVTPEELLKMSHQIADYEGFKIFYPSRKAAAMFPTYAVVKDGKMKTLVDVSDIEYQGKFLDAVVQKYEKMNRA